MKHRLLLLLLVACSDPVRDHEIERLGPEDPNVAAGPEHRPGQPCVLCHSAGGPASGHPFRVAGTIFKTDSPGVAGAENVEVRFVDGRSDGPADIVTTNKVGNFWVEEKDWNTTFPFRVGIFEDNKLLAEMTTAVDREGSCASCHGLNAPLPLTPEDSDRARQSIGQIYVQITGTK